MSEGFYHERGTSSLAHKLRIGVYVTLLRMKQTKADLRDYRTRVKLCEYRARVIIAYPNNHRKISVGSLESIRRHMNKIKTNSSLIPLYWNRSINRKPQTKGGISYIPWCIASYYIIKLPNARDPISSHQFDRDATVEQRWKATCFADKTFCTFAVSIYLRFSFYYSKYISC